MKVFCDTCGEMLVYHEDKKGNVESYCLKCETAALPTPNLGLPVMTKECDQRMCTLLRRIEKLERHVHYLPPVEVRPGDPTGVQQEHLEQPTPQQQPCQHQWENDDTPWVDYCPLCGKRRPAPRQPTNLCDTCGHDKSMHNITEDLKFKGCIKCSCRGFARKGPAPRQHPGEEVE